MTQLAGRRIIFNGYDLTSRFGVTSVTIKEGNERIIGVSRTTVRDDLNTVVGTNEGVTSLTVELLKTKGRSSIPVPFERWELDGLLRILFVDGVSKLENDGKIYYGTFVNNGSSEYYNDVCALQLEFELASPYAYVDGIVYKKQINGMKELSLMNLSSADKDIFIDIEIMNKSDSDGTFTIENPIVKKTFKINQINSGEMVKIMGDTREIYSETTPDKNFYPYIEGDFINLIYGKNNIKITTNTLMEVTIRYQIMKVIN